jgi:Family of unknown function (DUF6176)
MQRIAFAAPILPGKTEAFRDAMRAESERKQEFEASRERLGITREAVWLQHTPAGDVAIIYMEAEDLKAAFDGLGASQDPFDRWGRGMIRDVHGIDLTQGFPPPEQLAEYSRGR